MRYRMSLTKQQLEEVLDIVRNHSALLSLLNVFNNITIDDYNKNHIIKTIKQVITDCEKSESTSITVRVWNEGKSGEFRTVEGIDELPDGTKLYLQKDSNAN